MQGGVIGGICLLTFLLSKGSAEELGNIKDSKEAVSLKNLSVTESPDDLKSEVNLAVTESISQNYGERSGIKAPSGDRSFGGSPYGDGFFPARGAHLPGMPQISPINAFSSDIGPYIPLGTVLSQAEAQAIADAGTVGINSYPYSPPYPNRPGSDQIPVIADNGLFQPAPIATPILSLNNQASRLPESVLYQPVNATPIYNPYGPGFSPVPTQVQGDNRLYQPGLGPPNFNPYNKGLSQGQVESESYQPIEFNFKLSKSIQNYKPSSEIPSASILPYPFNQRPMSDSNPRPNPNSILYPNFPMPNSNFSPYERFLLPYHDSQINSENDGEHITEENHNESDSWAGDSISSFIPDDLDGQMRDVTRKQQGYKPYQVLPKFSPYDFHVPYNDVKLTKVVINNKRYQASLFPKRSPQSISKPYKMIFDPPADYSSLNNMRPPAENEPYQVIPIPDPNSAPYDSLLVPYNGPNIPQANTNNKPYQSIQIPKEHPDITLSRVSMLRTNPTQIQPQDKTIQYTPIPDISRSDESSTVPYIESNINRDGYDESELTQKSFSLSPDNIARTSKYNMLKNVDLKLKSLLAERDLYKVNPYLLSGRYPQLYPSDADAKPAASGANLYSMGMRTNVIDYPSESPFRPGGPYIGLNEALNPPIVFTSSQNTPIAFEDAKSRLIYPYEFVFPNKMPGGENIIKCTKENEFYHFWAPGVDCLVCICVNEYGLLTPVCANCGGCRNPPPRLPEPIPVQPANPEPTPPVPMMPEPYPRYPPPEPPIPIEPQPPSTSPSVYPEPLPTALPFPSPTPSPPFPEAIATLPPLPPEASCNPLPTGEPFTNPLHPCQICVCKELYVAGKPDVQIDCKENPQCISPDDVTTLPPLPDVPVSMPLPLCEKFPENVLFPHPTETCKLCKCSKIVSEAGIPEQQITCYPHPDCIPKPAPVTEPPRPGSVPPPIPLPVEQPYPSKPLPEPLPAPIEPLREPFPPIVPVPLPEVVTVEPLPWPPITTIAPVPTPVLVPVLTPKPGPLPGPSPHESCRPYPPNQPFQHPWDECQICVCSEINAATLINIEVNCYTKPSCCIEPPDAVKAALPGKSLFSVGFNQPYPGLVNISPESQALAVAQSGVIITSTYRPPQSYPSYTPRPVIYPINSQGAGADALTPPQVYTPAQYTRLQSEDSYPSAVASYPYQSSYLPSAYVNPQYSEYPTRLTAPASPYKSNGYTYPANYQYAQGEAMGNPYPPQGHFQAFDPRYQGVPAPSAYPSLYPIPNYELPLYAPGQVMDSYAQAQAQVGPNGQNMAQNYANSASVSKTGNEGAEESDDSQ